MLLEGIKDAAIQSVSFTFSNFGDFTVVDKETGIWDSNEGIWNCNGDNNVQSVMFKNSGDASLIKPSRLPILKLQKF